MSRKSKRKVKNTAAGRAGVSAPVRTKKINKKKIIALSVCVAVALAAIATLLVFLLAPEKRLNYLSADLSKYISIEENDYKNYSVELNLSKTDESDVERKIMNLLYKNRSKTPAGGGEEVVMVPVSVGDKVYIYYRGYTVADDGTEQDLEGASNITASSAHALEIGSLSFVKGFEEGLIGAKPWDYKLFAEDGILKSGSVCDGDRLFISYTRMLPSGVTEVQKGVTVRLSDVDLDERYGVAFKDFLLSSAIGSSLSEPRLFSYEGGSVVYTSLKIEYAIRSDNAPLTIDVQFPANYSEKSMRSLKARFDVYFKSSVVYDVPEYNSEFITDVLKVDESELSKYEGEGIVEKHRAMLLAEAEAEGEAVKQSLVEEAVWEHLNGAVKVKKLPQQEVKKVYEETYGELYSLYRSYYMISYDSFESFARAYYSLGAAGDWSARITEIAESVVVEKMIFYYIIRAEGLLPSEEEFSELYNGVVKEYLDYQIDNYYTEQLEKLQTEEEKASFIAEIKDEMLEYYGEDYFAELVYYDYALDDIIAYPTVFVNE